MKKNAFNNVPLFSALSNELAEEGEVANEGMVHLIKCLQRLSSRSSSKNCHICTFNSQLLISFALAKLEALGEPLSLINVLKSLANMSDSIELSKHWVSIG